MKIVLINPSQKAVYSRLKAPVYPRALKEMGTYSLSFGVESGSQRILNEVNKGIKIAEIKEVFRLSQKLRIETWAFFILGRKYYGGSCGA